MILSFMQDIIAIQQPPVLTCILNVYDSSFIYNETRDCKVERVFQFPDVENGQNYTYNVSITNIVGTSSKKDDVGMYLLI